MRIRRKFLDDALTLVVLLLATGAFQTFIVDPTDPRAATDGSPLLRVLWFAVYGAVVLRLIPHLRQVATLVRANRYLLMLVVLAISSIAWSQDPSLTLRKSIALTGTTLIGIDFAVRYSVREQLRLLYIVLGSVLLLGIAAQLLFPTLIPTADFDSVAWHGAWGAKNELARMAVLFAIVALSRSRRSLRDFLLFGCAIAGAFGLIALAHSAGALVILTVLLLLSKISGALRWKPKMLALGVLGERASARADIVLGPS